MSINLSPNSYRPSFLQSGSQTTLSSFKTLEKNVRYSSIANTPMLLSYLPLTFSIIHNVLSIPSQDAFRLLPKITTSTNKDQIVDVKRWLMKKGVMQTMQTLSQNTALYGGAGLIIDNYESDPHTLIQPFTDNDIKKGSEVDFIVANRWELTSASGRQYNKIIKSSNHNSALMKNALQKYALPYYADTFNYNGITVNADRIIKTKWDEPYWTVKQVMQGWGVPEMDKLVRTFNEDIKLMDVVFEFLDKAKTVDVSVPNLMDTNVANDDALKAVEKFMQSMVVWRNVHGYAVKDSRLDTSTTQLSMEWIKSVHDMIEDRIAAATRIPKQKLYSLQVGSMGDGSGSEVTQNYNQFVQTTQQERFRYVLHKIVEIGFTVLFGEVPEDLEIEYEPMSPPTEADKLAREAFDFNSLLQLEASGIIDGDCVLDNLKILNPELILPKNSSGEDLAKKVKQDLSE